MVSANFNLCTKHYNFYWITIILFHIVTMSSCVKQHLAKNPLLFLCTLLLKHLFLHACRLHNSVYAQTIYYHFKILKIFYIRIYIFILGNHTCEIIFGLYFIIVYRNRAFFNKTELEI